MHKYIVFLLMVQTTIFLHGMEESEREEKRLTGSPAGSVRVQVGSTQEMSHSQSMSSEDAGIQELADHVKQLVRINKEQNMFLSSLITIQREQLGISKKKLKLKKREVEFNTAAEICALRNSLEIVSPNSRNSRIRSGFGEWGIIEEESERLKNKMRKKAGKLMKKQIEEEAPHKKKKTKKNPDPATARRTKNTPRPVSARDKKIYKK